MMNDLYVFSIIILILLHILLVSTIIITIYLFYCIVGVGGRSREQKFVSGAGGAVFFLSQLVHNSVFSNPNSASPSDFLSIVGFGRKFSSHVA